MKSGNILPAERCLSVVGGSLLVISGLRRGLGNGKVRLLVGAELLRRGLSGHCYAYEALGASTSEGASNAGISAHVVVTINRPREEVFRFWRDFTNLPQVMNHLLSVEERGNGITRWTIRGPMDIETSFDAEVISETENESLTWRSLPESAVSSRGNVRFLQAPSGLGTELEIDMRYVPPAGRFGLLGAKLARRGVESMIESDCWRLKEFLETGEIATTEGQPVGPSERESRQRRVNQSADTPHAVGTSHEKEAMA